MHLRLMSWSYAFCTCMTFCVTCLLHSNHRVRELPLGPFRGGSFGGMREPLRRDVHCARAGVLRQGACVEAIMLLEQESCFFVI